MDILTSIDTSVANVSGYIMSASFVVNVITAIRNNTVIVSKNITS